MMNQKSVVIGIVGASGSGKSCLADTLTHEFGSDQVVIIHEDSYYKARTGVSAEERATINYDHPSAFDHDLMLEHLRDLQAGRDIEVPMYDYSVHDRLAQTRQVGQHRITILEGILLFVDPRIRDLIDVRIFMDAPLDICLIRRLQRDMKERNRSFDSVIEQYRATVRPMFLQFIEPSKLYADIIIPRGGKNRIAIDMIKAKMRELLGNTIPPIRQGIESEIG
jgi:uridine kinase